jgi:hypothetical protein
MIKVHQLESSLSGLQKSCFSRSTSDVSSSTFGFNRHEIASESPLRISLIERMAKLAEQKSQKSAVDTESEATTANDECSSSSINCSQSTTLSVSSYKDLEPPSDLSETNYLACNLQLSSSQSIEPPSPPSSSGWIQNVQSLFYSNNVAALGEISSDNRTEDSLTQISYEDQMKDQLLHLQTGEMMASYHNAETCQSCHKPLVHADFSGSIVCQQPSCVMFGHKIHVMDGNMQCVSFGEDSKFTVSMSTTNGSAIGKVSLFAASQKNVFQQQNGNGVIKNNDSRFKHVALLFGLGTTRNADGTVVVRGSRVRRTKKNPKQSSSPSVVGATPSRHKTLATKWPIFGHLRDLVLPIMHSLYKLQTIEEIMIAYLKCSLVRSMKKMSAYNETQTLDENLGRLNMADVDLLLSVIMKKAKALPTTSTNNKALMEKFDAKQLLSQTKVSDKEREEETIQSPNTQWYDAALHYVWYYILAEDKKLSHDTVYMSLTGKKPVEPSQEIMNRGMHYMNMIEHYLSSTNQSLVDADDNDDDNESCNNKDIKRPYRWFKIFQLITPTTNNCDFFALPRGPTLKNCETHWDALCRLHRWTNIPTPKTVFSNRKQVLPATPQEFEQWMKSLPIITHASE